MRAPPRLEPTRPSRRPLAAHLALGRRGCLCAGVPLHELCLQIKLLDLGAIEPFLARALEPPAPHAVREAVQTLSELQALEGPSETLTPLGHHLATLPVDVRIGKLLLLGLLPRGDGRALQQRAEPAVEDEGRVQVPSR